MAATPAPKPATKPPPPPSAVRAPAPPVAAKKAPPVQGAAKTIKLRIGRYRPERSAEPFYQEFTIPYRDDMVVLDALNYIKDHIDSTLTYRWSCRMGICGSCGADVDGTPKLTCALGRAV